STLKHILLFIFAFTTLSMTSELGLCVDMNTYIPLALQMLRSCFKPFIPTFFLSCNNKTISSMNKTLKGNLFLTSLLYSNILVTFLFINKSYLFSRSEERRVGK